MKKFFTIFFVTLGVIFLILILMGAYFFITDPLNLRPLLFNSGGGSFEARDANGNSDSESNTSASESGGGPTLSASQEAALRAVGIDPSNLPSTITAEQEDCFVEKLGSERVGEIKAGGTPTFEEFIKGRDCI